jgi:nucleoside-diphosphate-sugar epimerase
MSDRDRSGDHPVLVVGGTGRTGSAVIAQLRGRDVPVTAIVRSPEKLPRGAAADPGLTVIEADLLALSDAQLTRYVRGHAVVISCLGHVISVKGVFGAPRDLVAQATRRLCAAIDALEPEQPCRFILMSSVSVINHQGPDRPLAVAERGALSVIRTVVPPARDNQRAAEVLAARPATDPYVEWVVVRPDSLEEGDVGPYSLHPQRIASIFAADHTTIANVAHFMSELATSSSAWSTWRGQMPVIVDADADADAVADAGAGAVAGADAPAAPPGLGQGA